MKLATVNDVANVLKVKKSTLYAWVNQGAIPSYKLPGSIRKCNTWRDWLLAGTLGGYGKSIQAS